MALTIAVSGKGGSGKTTLSAMIIRHLMERAGRGVLAVDADPNACLGLALGVQAEKTVADLREETLGGKLPGADTDRERAFELAIHHALAEAKGFDLLVMGQPEGPKCYCAVNHNLRQVIDAISKNYGYVVIDNEAGMEHLSRRTTRDVDHLIIVSDPSYRGLVAAGRIAGFCNELDIQIKNAFLVLNRLTGEVPAPIQSQVQALGIPLLGIVPADSELADLESNGSPVIALGDESNVYRAIATWMEKIV